MLTIATVMIDVKDLTPGLTLSHAIITPDGKILLEKGGIITQRTIALLSIWDINHIHINIHDSIKNTLAEAKLNTVYSSDISTECAHFFQEYDTILTSTANSFDFVRNQHKIPIVEIKDLSFLVYSSILTTGSAIMDYLLISDHDLVDEVSRHSVMVAYICGLIGGQMNFSETELQTLTLSALLHDIGKMVIAKEGSREPHGHVINGGQLLRSVQGIPEEVMLSILQHHEFLDGTGFPMGVSGARIHPYAKIIAIANTFHNEAYKTDHCNPFIGLDKLSNDQFGKLDPTIYLPFIRKIRSSLLHTNVILSDDRQAEVLYFPPSNSNAPIVQTTDKKLIDLSLSKKISISRLCTPNYIAG